MQFINLGITALREKLESDRGANLVEYTLLVAFIAIVCIAAVSAIGDAAQDPLSEVGSTLGG